MDKICDFNQWLGSLPHRHKLIVAGNHDSCFQQIGKDKVEEILKNAHYLEHDTVSLHFNHDSNEDNAFCSKLFCAPTSIPNSDFFTNRAFQYEQKAIGPRIWSQIPENIDILVTHHMARGFMCNGKGCEYLLNVVKDKCSGCKYHLFGHWHGTYGVDFGGEGFRFERRDNVCFVTSCTVDDFMCAIHPPLVFITPFCDNFRFDRVVV